MERTQSAKRILLKALRSTFQGLERSEDLPPDDPALQEIKSLILRRMARREAEPPEGFEMFSEDESAA